MRMQRSSAIKLRAAPKTNRKALAARAGQPDDGLGLLAERESLEVSANS